MVRYLLISGMFRMLFRYLKKYCSRTCLLLLVIFTQDALGGQDTSIQNGYFHWEKSGHSGLSPEITVSFDQDPWRPMAIGSQAEGKEQGFRLWQGFYLPNLDSLRDPVIFVPNVDQDFKVYLDGQKIYSYGEMDPKKKQEFTPWAWHIIDLPPRSSAKPIIFHIASDHQNIGITGQPIIGSRADILSNIFQKALFKLLVVITLFIIGVVGLFLYTLVYQNKNILYLSTFVLSLGTYYGTRIHGTQLFFPSLEVKVLIELFSLYLTPIGLMCFLGNLIGGTPRKIYFFFGSLFLGIFSLAGLSSLLFSVHPIRFLLFFQITFVSALALYIFGAIYLLSFRRQPEMLFFASSIVIAALGGIIDLFVALALFDVPSFLSVSMIGMFFLNAAGITVILSNIKHEIAEKKILEHRERQRTLNDYQDRMDGLKTLAAGMAHEINNPLFIIEGNAELLMQVAQESGLDTKYTQKLGDNINHSVQRIYGITKSMILLSGHEGDHSPVDYMSISSILVVAKGEFFDALRHYHIEFTIDPKLESYQTNGRIQQLVLAFGAMIKNSIENICELEERWIRIEARFTPHKEEIRFIDSGKGISLENSHKIMTPFFSSKDNFGKEKRLGMGLSVAQGIFQQHGGWLKLDPAAPNTTFIVHLPLQSRDSQPPDISYLKSS